MNAQFKQKTTRSRLIQLIHIGKAALGLDEDTYRAMLESLTGKSSSTAMSETELEAVYTAMKKAGFAGTAPREKHLTVRPENIGDLTSRQVYYIKGLWELASRTQSEQSLSRLITRLTGVDDIRFVPREKANVIILALKDIARKAGFDPDGKRRRA